MVLLMSNSFAHLLCGTKLDEDDSEDKDELYADRVLRALLLYLGVGDPNITNVILEYGTY